MKELCCVIRGNGCKAGAQCECIRSIGPLIPNLRLVFKSLLSTEPWLLDPDCLAVPYREEKEISIASPPTLAFGYFESDRVVTPHPPIIRALRIASKALQSAGHKVLYLKHAL